MEINNQHMHMATDMEQFFNSTERTRCCVMMQKERLDFFSLGHVHHLQLVYRRLQWKFITF